MRHKPTQWLLLFDTNMVISYLKNTGTFKCRYSLVNMHLMYVVEI